MTGIKEIDWQEANLVSSLRPSALPKVAACPSFMGKPFEAGPPAQRGTLADEAFRDAMQGDMERLERLDADILALAEENKTTLEPAEDGIRWAISTARFLSKGTRSLTADEDCRVKEIPEYPVGEPPISSGRAREAHGDLKTGADPQLPAADRRVRLRLMLQALGRDGRLLRISPIGKCRRYTGHSEKV